MNRTEHVAGHMGERYSFDFSRGDTGGFGPQTHDFPEPKHMAAKGPPISRAWKRGVVWGNAALGAIGMAVGGTDTLSVSIDGAHNAADAATYEMQASDVLDPDQPHEKLARRRKLAHWIITVGAIGGVAKAGLDMQQGKEHTADILDVSVAAGSVALNGLMFARLWKGMGGKIRDASASAKDLVKHFAYIDMPSAALALGGSVVQNTSFKTEQIAAVASGVVGAVAFWPSERNLGHNCLDHSDAGRGHADDHAPKQRGWGLLESARKKGRAAEIAIGGRIAHAASGLKARAGSMLFHQDTGGERKLRRGRAALLAMSSLALGAYTMNRWGVDVSESTQTPSRKGSLPLADAWGGPDALDSSTVESLRPLAPPEPVIDLQPGDNPWRIVGDYAQSTGLGELNLQQHDALNDFTRGLNGLGEDTTGLPVGYELRLPDEDTARYIAAAWQ